MSTSLCEELDREFGALFVCSEVNEYIRIRTPFYYPDGDIIDLFSSKRCGELMFTDCGETIRWLKMQTTSLRRSPKQNQIIQDVCLTNGVEKFRGMLVSRADKRSGKIEAIIRLAQACIRVADLWFTFRTHAVDSVTDEVADFLTENSIIYERSEKMQGRSGRVWRPDFHTFGPEFSSLIYVLSSGSKVAARGLTNDVVAAWFDLSHLKIGREKLHFISLFDDSMDVWTENEFAQVAELSEVARWSRPYELLEALDT